MRRTSLERKVGLKFEEYRMLRDQAKELYSAADALLLEIGQLVSPKPIATIMISPDELLEVTDLSKGKDINLGWGHASVKRYELKIRKA